MQIFVIFVAHHPFYIRLTNEGKNKFVNRVGKFITAKRFIGMEGLEVNLEMKVRIAATAVQITFGLVRSDFSHYKVIKIFPESFYSRMFNRYLKGGASTGGTLFFSWKDFKEGFDDPTDRYNLGLHEMAHALRLELLHGNSFDERFANYSDHWVSIALPEFEKINKGNTSFLREYGGTNIEEFFAVCVEHFFEVPLEFKQSLPDIFNHLCYLLNLDPNRPHDDYKLERDFKEKVNADPNRLPLPTKVGKAYQYYSWHWSFNVIVAGLFVGIGVMVFLIGKVLYSAQHVLLIFLLTAGIISSFRQFLFKKGIYYLRHLMLFSLAGAAPIVCSLLLIANYTIKTSYSRHAYRVTDYSIVQNYDKGYPETLYLLQLEGGAFSRFRDIRSVSTQQIRMVDFNKTVYFWITTSSGIFGIPNFEESGVVVYSAKPNKTKG